MPIVVQLLSATVVVVVLLLPQLQLVAILVDRQEPLLVVALQGLSEELMVHWDRVVMVVLPLVVAAVVDTMEVEEPPMQVVEVGPVGVKRKVLSMLLAPGLAMDRQLSPGILQLPLSTQLLLPLSNLLPLVPLDPLWRQRHHLL